MKKIIFITGTDTGVGKTILTALLLSRLRQTGFPANALKPFCSGGRADAELLHSLQNTDLTLGEVNPFHFSEPLTPLVAARLHNRKITLRHALRHFEQITAGGSNPPIQKLPNPKLRSTPPLPHSTAPILFIEGAGGLLSPLGENFNLLDLMATFSIHHPAFSIETIVVAPNRLGTINHTLLTIHTLRAKKVRQIKVVLMDCDRPSPSRTTQPVAPELHASLSNPSILTELLSPIPLFRIPYLAKNLGKPEQILQFAKKCKKTLAQILA